MKAAVVVLVFVLSLTLLWFPFTMNATEPLNERDSIMVQQRERAIADFKRRIVTIPGYKFACRFYYAEEVLYQRYGIKADMYVFPVMCGAGREWTDLCDSCYNAVMDSLMFAKFGKDIYSRIAIAGDSLEKKFPERYPMDETLICWKPLYDSDSVNEILRANIKYPLSAKRDTVQGTVYVWLEYDSTGSVIATSVCKSVRPDLDSAAMSGAMHIKKVNPDFRWGVCQPGKTPIPVKFVLE